MELPNTSSTPAKTSASTLAGRVASIDAFRGLVMFLMGTSGNSGDKKFKIIKPTIEAAANTI
jgi:hypothetical protein